MQTAGSITYLYGDHLGSTSAWSGTNGGTQTYYPYGAVRTTSGTLPTDYTFTGQRVDASAGLMYYGARYYDAAIGRFVQPDVVVPNPLNPQDLNRYTYARDNPLRYKDPRGHIPIDWLLDILGIGFDVYQLATEPSWENAGWLGLDVVLWAAPYVPAAGGATAKATKMGKIAARVEARVARFAGAAPEIERGVSQLGKLSEDTKIPQRFRKGFEAELQRAEKFFKEGKLKGVEVIEGKNHFDLVLDTGDVVEVKYWTETYANKHIDDLIAQLKRYYDSGRDVSLELGRTKNNPVTEEFIEDLLRRAKDAEIPLTRGKIRFFDLE